MPVQKPPVTLIDNFEIVEFSTPPHWGITVALRDVLAAPVHPDAVTPPQPRQAGPSPEAASAQDPSPAQDEGNDRTEPSAGSLSSDSPSGGLEKILPSGIASAHLEADALILVPRGGSRAFRRLHLARPRSDLWQRVFSESHFTVLVLAADGTPVFEQMLRSPTQPAAQEA